MRKLNTLDVFTLSKIYSKMDIKLDVDNKTSQMEMGVQLINKFMANLWKAQDDVIEFLASVKNISKKDFEQMPPTELIKTIKEILEQEGAADFFISAMQ